MMMQKNTVIAELINLSLSISDLTGGLDKLN